MNYQPPFIKVYWPELQAICGNCNGTGVIAVAYTASPAPLCRVCNGNGIVRKG